MSLAVSTVGAKLFHLHFLNVFFNIINLVHMEMLEYTALDENTGHFCAVIDVADSDGL